MDTPGDHFYVSLAIEKLAKHGQGDLSFGRPAASLD